MGGRGSSSGVGGRSGVTKSLSELEVGDRAYVHSVNTRGNSYREVKVTKVTKTQITTDDGNRWFNGYTK